MEDHFLKRLSDYALKTKIALPKTECRREWIRAGLPDMRGFSPHLRAVNLSSDSSFSWEKINSQEFLKNTEFQWLTHDLLHIIFYDFASLHLEASLWRNQERFYECHLASELFAVLALDYHYLVNTPVRGLAVDLKARDWTVFQGQKPELPDMQSFEFCRELAQLYFSGTGLLLDLGRDPKTSPAFSTWLGHELRYSDKQRHYVLAWREDLEGKKPTHQQVQLFATFIAEPLWDLLRLFHESPEGEWRNFLKEVVALKKPKNYFQDLPKFKKEMKAYDFRFTSFKSLPKTTVEATLENSSEPSASSLFLFWQIVSLISANLVSKKDRQWIQRLALASQSTEIPTQTWLAVREICRKRLSSLDWRPSPDQKATFYLP